MEVIETMAPTATAFVVDINFIPKDFWVVVGEQPIGESLLRVLTFYSTSDSDVATTLVGVESYV